LHIGLARCRHRINDDRRFLPLKLIDGPYPSAGQPFLKLEDLSVVGRDDQDIIESDRLFDASAIDPGRAGAQRRLIASFADDAIISDILADPHNGFGRDRCLNVFVSE
jgi:hypothetical protein